MKRFASIAVIIGILACASGCATRYNHFVRIEHEGETELGVATDQGILFTGRNVQDGEVKLISSFQSDQLFEIPGMVERYEDNIGLIRSPGRFLPLTVSDRNPTPEDSVQIAGLGPDGEEWYLTAYVPEESVISGTLLSCSSLWDKAPHEIAGAAVVVWRNESWQLAGLVWGRVDYRGERYAAFADVREISRVYRGVVNYMEPERKVYLPGINTTPNEWTNE